MANCPVCKKLGKEVEIELVFDYGDMSVGLAPSLGDIRFPNADDCGHVWTLLDILSGESAPLHEQETYCETDPRYNPDLYWDWHAMALKFRAQVESEFDGWWMDNWC